MGGSRGTDEAWGFGFWVWGLAGGGGGGRFGLKVWN